MFRFYYYLCLQVLLYAFLFITACNASSDELQLLLEKKYDPAIAIYEEQHQFFFDNDKGVPSSSSNYNDDKDDDDSSIITIKLWPNDHAIPHERPGFFGNESVDCGNDDACTDRRIRNVTIPTLTAFLLPQSDSAMIVAPGGGYNLLAFDKEGVIIAQWLNSIGISAFVLKYRVPGRPWLRPDFGSAPLMDAQRAMRLIRYNHTNMGLTNLNTSKIGFMGFSAGAHLTGHLSVAWNNNRSYYPPVDPVDEVSCRPDYSIMVYPWRSVSQPPVNEPNAIALYVASNTPPTLLVQTQDDPVHVENAIYYYLALKNARVSPSELHVYPKGGHGYGNCALQTTTKHLEVCTWTDRAKAFLQTLGVVIINNNTTANEKKMQIAEEEQQ